MERWCHMVDTLIHLLLTADCEQDRIIRLIRVASRLSATTVAKISRLHDHEGILTVYGKKEGNIEKDIVDAWGEENEYEIEFVST